MRHILFNMPSQHGGIPSGVPRVAFMLLEALLAETDWNFTLRSPWRRDQLPAVLQDSRLKVVTIERPRILIFNVFLEAFSMPGFCRKHAVDLMINLDPFGAPLGARTRVTIVHDLYFRAVPEQFSPRVVFTNNVILRLVLAGSHRIACVSHATERDVARWFPQAAGKTRTIHSSATLSAADITPTPVDGVESRYMLVVGNATPNKNFTAVAEAFNMLADSHPGLRIVHVGKDDEGVIGKALRAGLAEDRLTRLSGLSDAQLAFVYANAACLCVPSWYEGFCLPILEAQDFGCPVLSSNISAMPEIAGDGALYFDPREPRGLADHVASLLDNPELAAKLIEAGKANRERYSWRITARNYAELFREASAKLG